jgi:DNA N-6-adenine-methyltransferase (Dam).
VCWCNPPYGKGIGRWIRKARDSTAVGTVVVCLLPARTDTAWWHDYVMEAAEIRFIRGRIYFKSPEAPTNKDPRTPFPSAVVVFRPS